MMASANSKRVSVRAADTSSMPSTFQVSSVKRAGVASFEEEAESALEEELLENAEQDEDADFTLEEDGRLWSDAEVARGDDGEANAGVARLLELADDAGCCCSVCSCCCRK